MKIAELRKKVEAGLKNRTEEEIRNLSGGVGSGLYHFYGHDI
jgi:hypothetical protein